MCTVAESLKELFSNHIIQSLSAFAKEQNVQLYLVGGSVRDLLLRRQTTDIDFALASDAIQFAKAFANCIGATCIALEENPSTARVIVKQHDTPQTPQLSMDFVQFRAASLTEDLRLRDLTINAMAIAFENAEAAANSACEQNPLHVIDPCGGMNDLAAGLLQFLSEKVVHEDPVRLIRIYRFAAQLDFKISQNAIHLVKKHRSLLSEIAAERCRDELMKILNVKKAHLYLQEMEIAGLLTQIIRDISKSWSPLERFEENPIPAALTTYREEISAYLQEKLGMGVTRGSLIKLSLLLADDLGDIGKRLRLSQKAIQLIAHLVAGGKRLKEAGPHPTQKQIIRFLRTYRSDWWGVLLYTAASDSINAALLKEIANTYYKHILPVCKQGRLITGKDLIQVFQLKEGKQIGGLLEQIEERQFDGEIRTREEALAAVAALIQSS